MDTAFDPAHHVGHHVGQDAENDKLKLAFSHFRAACPAERLATIWSDRRDRAAAGTALPDDAARPIGKSRAADSESLLTKQGTCDGCTKRTSAKLLSAGRTGAVFSTLPFATIEGSVCDCP
jgi:hypothetical protein